MSKNGSVKREKSNLKYLFKKFDQELKGDKMVTLEKKLIDGDRGISFNYYNRNGDKVVKYSGVQNSDGTFKVFVIQGDTRDTHESMSLEDVLKMFAKIKELDFIVKYLKKNPPKMKRVMRRKRTSRRKKRKSSKKRTPRRKKRKSSKKRTPRRKKRTSRRKSSKKKTPRRKKRTSRRKSSKKKTTRRKRK